MCLALHFKSPLGGYSCLTDSPHNAPEHPDLTSHTSHGHPNPVTDTPPLPAVPTKSNFHTTTHDPVPGMPSCCLVNSKSCPLIESSVSSMKQACTLTVNSLLSAITY